VVVPPADRIAWLKAANTADETLDETLAENLRLLQELSDSRFDLMMERAGKRRAADFKIVTDGVSDEEKDDAEDEDDVLAGEPPAKRARACTEAGCSNAERPHVPLRVVVPSVA